MRSPTGRGRRKKRHRSTQDDKDIRGMIDKHRASAHRHIPNRGTTDANGYAWDGIPKMKLKYRDLDNDNLAENSADGRVIAPGSVADGHINGRLGKNSVAADTAYQNDIPKQGNQLSWGNGNRFIPDGALAQDYAKADAISGINQKLQGVNQKIQNMQQQIRSLKQGKKKK